MSFILPHCLVLVGSVLGVGFLFCFVLFCLVLFCFGLGADGSRNSFEMIVIGIWWVMIVVDVSSVYLDL